MKTRRTKSNAAKALGWLFWLLAIAAVVVFVQVTDSETGRVWRQAALLVFVAAVILLPPIDTLIARASRHLAPWVVERDLPWRLATLVLHATAPLRWLGTALRRAACAFWRALKGSAAYRFLDRHRRAVLIVLVAAISLRALAAFSLLQPGAGVTLWHWAAFGPAYLAFGITAPFVAAVLLWWRGEWVLVVAAIWLLLGAVGVVFSAVFSLFFASAYFAAEPQALLLHPLLPEPLGAGSWAALALAELLVQVAALHFLGGRTVDHYHGRPSTAC